MCSSYLIEYTVEVNMIKTQKESSYKSGIKSRNKSIAFIIEASRMVTHYNTNSTRTNLTSPSGREGVCLSLI